MLQIGAQRARAASPVSTVANSVVGVAETAISATVGVVRGLVSAIVAVPGLETDVVRLRARNERLIEENDRLHELASAYAAQSGVRSIVDLYRGIEGRVIGFPPENESRAVTIDKGSLAGVRADEGVLAAGGVVGRVVSVGPLSSTVVLVTDYTSRIPAVVRRGRWWGIARGNLTSVVVDYIEQDAPVHVGDVVVTGEGRSFHSGLPIGTVIQVERGNATLSQTVVLRPSIDLGALDRVVVVPK